MGRLLRGPLRFVGGVTRQECATLRIVGGACSDAGSHASQMFEFVMPFS